MENFEGLIAAMPVNTGDIESGAIVLVEGNNKYHRVTVSHINRNGYWIVEGDYNGPIEDPKFFYRLYAINDQKKYLIIFKNYEKIISKQLINDKKYYKFKLKPFKFKPGKFQMTCTECNSHFDGSSTQPLCKVCCEEHSTVELITTETVSKKIASQEELVDLCLTSYKKGVNNTLKDDFDTWLIKEIKKL